MCLIVFAHEHHPNYPFIFAANRDERHERPTRQAHFWEDRREILAGRDEVAGGTWCGVTRGGRFAAISNFRDPTAHDSEAPSRGGLVTGFLADQRPPGKHLKELEEKASAYNGFNLLVGDLKDGEIHYYSNRGGSSRRLGSGIYGLSNHLLDTPWPKVTRSKKRLAELADPDTDCRPDTDKLFALLQSTDRPPDEKLPNTGLELETERLVSAPFIVNPAYGTRSSTVIVLNQEGTLTFIEKTYNPDGEVAGTVEHELSI